MTRNCSKYGIYFLVSCSATSSLGFMAENNFPQKIMLNMTDQSDFSVYFANSPIPNKNAGRGVIEIDEPYEFQTALVFKESDYSKNLAYVFEQLNRFLKNPAEPIPLVPRSVTFDMVKNYITDLSNVPLGINEKSAQIGYYDFSNLVSVMTSSSPKILSTFIGNFLKTISCCRNNKVVVLNAISKEKFTDEDNIKEYTSGFKKVISVLNDNLSKSSSDTVSVVILGYNKLQSHLKEEKEADESVITLDDLISNTNSKYKYIIYESADNYDEFKQFKVYDYVDDGYGLWIGSGFDEQMVFSVENSYSNDHSSRNDEVTVVVNGSCIYVKYVK